jgi:hypothetical protein
VGESWSLRGLQANAKALGDKRKSWFNLQAFNCANVRGLYG